MRRILPLALMLLLLAATVQAAGPQKQLPGDLTLAQAQEVLKAALVKAEAQGVPMKARRKPGFLIQTRFSVPLYGAARFGMRLWTSPWARDP